MIKWWETYFLSVLKTIITPKQGSTPHTHHHPLLHHIGVGVCDVDCRWRLPKGYRTLNVDYLLTFEYRILELDVGVSGGWRGRMMRWWRQQHRGPCLMVCVDMRHQWVARTIHPFAYGAPVLFLSGRVLVGHVPLQTRFRAQHFAAGKTREHFFHSCAHKEKYINKKNKNPRSWVSYHTS